MALVWDICYPSDIERCKNGGFSMATATIQKRRKNGGIRPPIAGSDFEFDESAAFFMPAGSMSLSEFRQWTYSDRFPKTGLIAYIGKEIFIDMSPERLVSHGSVKSEICNVVGNLIRKKKRGKFYVDRTRFVNTIADVSNEPDALFASWESFKNGTVKFVPTAEGDDYIELEGTVDWILEIVSPSSVVKDTKLLRKNYHEAGVPEYWLVDARGDDVDFQILIRSEDDYKPARSVGNWQVSRVFAKRFRLRRIKDELGGIDFQLDMK
jgi:Uma2 family endonuclease